MNTNSIPKSQKVKEAVKSSPLLIPHFLNDPNYDNKIVYGIIKQLIPFRVGVELECGGKLHDSNTSMWAYNEYLKHLNENKLKVIDIKSDAEFSKMREHKISFDYKSIKGFYLFLELMKEKCTVNILGACHIHIDNIYKLEIHSLNYEERNTFRKNLEKYLSKTEEIFGEYEGTYNPRRVEYFTKEGWICVRENTYEFRIGKCNFEYETLIDWIIKCSSLIKEFNNILKQIKYSKELPSITTRKENTSIINNLERRRRRRRSMQELNLND